MVAQSWPALPEGHGQGRHTIRSRLHSCYKYVLLQGLRCVCCRMQRLRPACSRVGAAAKLQIVKPANPVVVTAYEHGHNHSNNRGKQSLSGASPDHGSITQHLWR